MFVYTIKGCQNDAALSYNSRANVACTDNDSTDYGCDSRRCVTPVYGCTDHMFVEYDPLANTDDGSCNTTAVFGCPRTWSFQYYLDACDMSMNGQRRLTGITVDEFSTYS